MKISEVHVENLGPAKALRVPLRFLTHMVGSNGAGKSTVLRALDVFFQGNTAVARDNVYGGNPELDIRITVTFEEIPVDLGVVAGQYVRDDTLKITARVTPGERKTVVTHHGWLPRNPDFEGYAALDQKTLAAAYRTLRSTEPYQDLPPETGKGKILENLRQWEFNHAEGLPLGEDDGGWFGVGSGEVDLRRWVDFQLIPAVRDAADELSRGGTLGRILSEVATDEVLTNENVEAALKKARQQVKDAINELLNPTQEEIKSQINEVVKTFAPTAVVDPQFLYEEMGEPSLAPLISVAERGHAGRVGLTGHGVQRSLIFSVLQFRALRDAIRVGQGEQVPRLILAIEEPEIFQHPSRQRALSRLLIRMAQGDGQGDGLFRQRVQVLTATHSPLFPNAEWFDCIRRIDREPSEGGPDVAVCHHANMVEVAHAKAEFEGREPKADEDKRLRKVLRSIMTPWLSEGFFARRIILVEGPSDRAALLATARIHGVDLDDHDIAVLPVVGKNNLLPPLLVFRALSIPTFVVWDGDKTKGKGREANLALQRSLGVAEPSEYPGDTMADGFAIYEEDLETKLRSDDEIGAAAYDAAVAAAQVEFELLGKDDVTKSPEAMEFVLEHARKAGSTSSFLRKILLGAGVPLPADQKSAPIPTGGAT